MIGHGNEALGQLLVLRFSVKQKANIGSDKTLVVWNHKLSLSIVNMLLRQHQWSNAINELKVQFASLVSAHRLETGKNTSLRFEVLYLCKIARVMIHIGDLIAGERYLDFAKETMSRAVGTIDGTNIEDYLNLSTGILLQAKDQVT